MDKGELYIKVRPKELAEIVLKKKDYIIAGASSPEDAEFVDVKLSEDKEYILLKIKSKVFELKDSIEELTATFL